MSNIIKSGRIRSQGFLDLSQRLISTEDEVYGDELSDDVKATDTDIDLELIHKKTEALARLDEEIQKRQEEATKKIEKQLAEALVQKEEMITQARSQAETILAEAHQKQAEIIQLAHDEAKKIEKTAEQEKYTLLESIEGEVVETMITLLQHIISEETNYSIEWLRLIVRKMILEDGVAESFKLCVSPHNLELIEQDKEHFMEGLKKVTQIVSDEALEDTACILVTSQGQIEYDISQGLERVIKEIRILKGIS